MVMDMKASGERDSPDLLEGSVYYVFLYGVISFILVLVALLLLYVACSKRYRLNWFEKNLLERADNAELATSQDALMSVATESEAGSSRSLLNIGTQDKFWVPSKNAKRSSLCPGDINETSGDDSAPGTPATPVDSKTSLLNLTDGTSLDDSGDQSSTGAPQPIARSEKHVVLCTTNPVRPRVSSMNTKLDHTKIDTSLYQKPMESRSPSIEDLRGSVHISMTYDPAAGILSVRLIQAQELLAREFSGTADPYAKIRLLPDRNNVWQTRIHKKTLNPVFDEDFVFEVRPAQLSRRTLEIILYDFDAYSRHHSIGGIKLPLSEIDLAEKVTLWKGLSPCSESDSKAELGDLMVSLAFLQSAERLTVVVIKGRNLRIVDDSRTSSDPYVKVSLLQGGKRLKKKKTSVLRNTVNPVFNEAFTFDVNRDTLSKCSIEFCVYHDNKLGTCELLGRAVVGSSSSCRQEEKQFFQEMLSSKTAIAQWLVLTDPQ